MSLRNQIVLDTQGFGDEEEDEEELDEEEEPEETEEEDQRVNLKLFGIHQALPIPDGEPDWDSGPPETAEEYLRRVRAEAAACPRVVRVEFDAEAHAAKQRARAAAQQEQEQGRSRGATPTPTEATPSAPAAVAMPGEATTGVVRSRTRQQAQGASPPVASYVARLLAAGTLQDGPAWTQPSQQWVRQLTVDFRNLRQWLAQTSIQHAQELSQVRVPHVNDVSAWERICFGIVKPGQEGKEYTNQYHHQQHHQQEQQWGQQQGGGGITLHVVPAPPSDAPASDLTPALTPATQAVLNPPASIAEQQPSGHKATQQQEHQQAGVAEAAEEAAAGPSSQGGGGSTRVVAAVFDPQGSLPGGVGSGQQDGSTVCGVSVTPAAAAAGLPRLPGPVLSTVLCLDQVTVSMLVQRCVAHVEGSGAVTEQDAHWLFALAAVLEKPAHSDVVAALRCLTRRVMTLRGALAGAATGGGGGMGQGAAAGGGAVGGGGGQGPGAGGGQGVGVGEGGIQEGVQVVLARLNTLAVVAGAYFGQDEKLVRCVADLDLP